MNPANTLIMISAAHPADPTASDQEYHGRHHHTEHLGAEPVEQVATMSP
jgi:hypothetical protein